MNTLLVNTATNEFNFIRDFFSSPTAGDKANQETFNKLFVAIFNKSLTVIYNSLDSFLSQSFDGITILLMIQMNQNFESTMHKRKISALDFYYDEILERLWPRFTVILEKNLESVQNASVDKLFPTEKTSHTVGKRYAEFSSAVHALTKETKV